VVDASTLPIWLTALAAVLLTAAALCIAIVASAKADWRPAGGLLLLAVSPTVPHVPVTFGLSLDDILPLVAVVLLALGVLRDRAAVRDAWRLIGSKTVRGLAVLAAEAIVFVVGAAAFSSVANASGPADAFRLFARSGVRYLLMAVIVVLAVLANPPRRRMALLTHAIALVGAAEATFGVIAYVLPLPGRMGLELARKNSVLYENVPGRVAGTIGLSPDFLGALFLFTVPLTVALALESGSRRDRVFWWAAAGVQALALGLTFARVSLVLVAAEVVVLMLWRGRMRYIVPLGACLLPVAIFTPAIRRISDDVPDRLALWTSGFRMMIDHPFFGVGSGNMVAVELAQPARYGHTAFGAAEVNAHNTLLLAGAELGTMGFVAAVLLNVALAVLAARMLWLCFRDKRQLAPAAASLAVLAFLVQGMVNDLFTVAVVGTLAAVVIGGFLVVDPDELPAAIPEGGGQGQTEGENKVSLGRRVRQAVRSLRAARI
jgi:O-antigen ligase